MKKIALFIMIIFSHLSWAQETNFMPNTGDNEMDVLLKKVNNDAIKDVTAFKNMVTNKFNIAKKDIEKLLIDMLPGDVYMAAEPAEAPAVDQAAGPDQAAAPVAVQVGERDQAAAQVVVPAVAPPARVEVPAA